MQPGNRDDFVFFWGGVFSQWPKCPFFHAGIKYSRPEQWMMAKKAELFGDSEAMLSIMRAQDPKQQKALGRKVRGFKEDVWTEHAYSIVKHGNILKFSQNPDARKQLLATGKKVIVEASPYDRIWGIGLAEDHPDAPYPDRWKGKNLLGKALMEVRDILA